MSNLGMFYRVFKLTNEGFRFIENVCSAYSSEEDALKAVTEIGVKNSEYVVLPVYYVWEK